jgi:hypothetical protein
MKPVCRENLRAQNVSQKWIFSVYNVLEVDSYAPVVSDGDIQQRIKNED